MKRIISLLLLCGLLCACLAACGKTEPADNYVLTSFIVADVTYDASDLNALGLEGDVTVSFASDHTGTLCFGGLESAFTWDESYLRSEGETIPYRLEDGRLILTLQDADLIFE